MELRSKIPSGPIENRWEKHRFDMNLVNPANKRKYTIIVVGTGLAGGSASASTSDGRIRSPSPPWSVRSTIVEAMPPGQVPPSKIRSMRVSNWANTPCAVSGAGWPERLALVTASGAFKAPWFGERDNIKFNVGEPTTTVINLAASLSLADQRILVVDLDPQGNLTSGLGMKGRAGTGQTVYEALTREPQPPLDEFVLESSVEGLALVPADRNLTGAELELVSVANRERRTHDLLRPMRDRFDFVLVDTPPSLGLLTLNALVAADSVLVPLQTEYYALEGLSVMVKLIEQLREIPGVRGVHIQAIEWEHRVPEIVEKAGLLPRPAISQQECEHGSQSEDHVG